jgi:hypothetical protein
MVKPPHPPSDDWLATYVRNHVLDTLAPGERMQFRMACGRGAEAVLTWAEATLPKYSTVWRRLKSAERQRRYRSVPSTRKWMSDWSAAERTLGRQATEILRRRRGALHLGRDASPAAALASALDTLEELLDARAPTLTHIFVEGPPHPPRAEPAHDRLGDLSPRKGRSGNDG